MSDALGLWIRRLQVNLLRIKHVILGPRNPRKDGSRGELLVVEAYPPHDALHDLLLVGLVIWFGAGSVPAIREM